MWSRQQKWPTLTYRKWYTNTRVSINGINVLALNCAYSYFNMTVIQERKLATVTNKMIRTETRGKTGARSVTGANTQRLITPRLRGALLIEDFQDIFGNLLQLMPCFITLFADPIEEDCALVTFMTWRFILQRRKCMLKPLCATVGWHSTSYSTSMAGWHAHHSVNAFQPPLDTSLPNHFGIC